MLTTPHAVQIRLKAYHSSAIFANLAPKVIGDRWLYDLAAQKSLYC